MNIIVFLWSLLFYQHCDATLGEYCTPLKSLQSWELLTVEPGSTPELIPSNTNDCGSVPYTLLYQNQSSGKLEHLYDQDNHKVMTPPIYLNTSGIYCVYKQCESAQIDQCCKKLTVPTQMQILLSESRKPNTLIGSCSVQGWPRSPINDTTVHANDGCKIKTLSASFVNDYTTTVSFAIHLNSSCERITCLAPSKQEHRTINTSNLTTHNPPTTTSTTIPITTEVQVPTEGDVLRVNTNDRHSGVLGIYRITLWIIVLTLAMINIIIY